MRELIIKSIKGGYNEEQRLSPLGAIKSTHEILLDKNFWNGLENAYNVKGVLVCDTCLLPVIDEKGCPYYECKNCGLLVEGQYADYAKNIIVKRFFDEIFIVGIEKATYIMAKNFQFIKDRNEGVCEKCDGSGRITLDYQDPTEPNGHGQKEEPCECRINN